MPDTFPSMLERVLQQSQQQLYSELLALLERQTSQTSEDLQRNGLNGLRDAASPMPQLGTLPNCRQLDGLHGITAEKTEPIGMVSNVTDSSPEHTVSGRRSLTYELAIKASAPSEADADKLASKSMSLTDVLTTEVGASQGRIGKLVSSWQFEAFFAAVILTNSVFIGVVIQWESENSFAGTPDSIYAVSIGYGILFTVELLLRMIAAGPWSFYCNANWAWNVFDTLIVASVLYEFLVDTGGQSTSMSSNLRVLRVVRLTRAHAHRPGVPSGTILETSSHSCAVHSRYPEGLNLGDATYDTDQLCFCSHFHGCCGQLHVRHVPAGNQSRFGATVWNPAIFFADAFHVHLWWAVLV